MATIDRKLVTIRTIQEIHPIDGADNIVKAIIDGWSVVVRKSEFAVGDKCLYFEIDSFLPASDTRFAFLERNKRVWHGKEGYRLKSIKLKKTLSQGLALPIQLFPETAVLTEQPDTDLASLLGIEKWEEDIPAQLAGTVRGNFPSFIPKTDQERIQNVYKEIDITAEYEATIKMDGSSLTVYRRDDHIGICSRNLELKNDESNKDNAFIIGATQSGIIDGLLKSGKNYAVQAELCGPGLNGNRAGFAGICVYVFDIYDIDNKRYLTPTERAAFYSEYLAGASDMLYHAPVLGTGVRPELVLLSNALQFAEKQTVNNTPAEGVVYKRMDGQGSFKVISNVYLLKHDL